MALLEASLSAKIVANMGNLGGDSKEANAQYDEGIKKIADAVAKAVVECLTTEAEVFIPTGAVAVVGTPNASNPAPVLGKIQ